MTRYRGYLVVLCGVALIASACGDTTSGASKHAAVDGCNEWAAARGGPDPFSSGSEVLPKLRHALAKAQRAAKDDSKYLAFATKFRDYESAYTRQNIERVSTASVGLFYLCVRITGAEKKLRELGEQLRNR